MTQSASLQAYKPLILFIAPGVRTTAIRPDGSPVFYPFLCVGLVWFSRVLLECLILVKNRDHYLQVVVELNHASILNNEACECVGKSSEEIVVFFCNVGNMFTSL